MTQREHTWATKQRDKSTKRVYCPVIHVDKMVPKQKFQADWQNTIAPESRHLGPILRVKLCCVCISMSVCLHWCWQIFGHPHHAAAWKCVNISILCICVSFFIHIFMSIFLSKSHCSHFFLYVGLLAFFKTALDFQSWGSQEIFQRESPVSIAHQWCPPKSLGRRRGSDARQKQFGASHLANGSGTPSYPTWSTVPKNHGTIHHAINGKTKTISTGPWLQVRKLLVYKRVYTYNMGPPVISRRFINPINYSYIINHSYWSYKPT